MWGPQVELLRAPAASSTDSIPIGFHRQKLWGLIFLALEPWAGGPGVSLELLAPEIPSRIFIHMGVGPAFSASVPHLLVWMDVVSSIP